MAFTTDCKISKRDWKLVYEYLSSNSIGKVTIMRTAIFVYQKYFLFLFFFLLLIPGILGLLHAGFFLSDDGNWMVIRFSAFYEALRSGQFPVRFLPRLLNGYGYPVADFLYPLFMYVGVPIHLIGVNFVGTIKILFGLSFGFSALFCLVWLRKFFDIFLASIGAFVYAYFPYHVWDMYKRGSLGEMLAMAIIPYILWQIEEKNVFFVGIGVGALLVAHNTLALLFLPIITLYYFLRSHDFFSVAWALCIGFGLSAFFWLPALIDKQYTVFDSKSVSNFSSYFLTNSSFGLLGILFLLLFVASLAFVYKKNTLAIFFCTILVISSFLALPFSKIVWDVLPVTSYIQFPFRLLSLTTLASAFLSSYVLSCVSGKSRLYASIGLIVFLIISVLPYMHATYQYYPDSWYSTNEDSTTVQNEYLPLWVQKIPQQKTGIASV